MTPTLTPPADAARTSQSSSIEALQSLWERQQGPVDKRIEMIEQAVGALYAGGADGQLREDAQRAAHMLAGSLGMFGFTGASGVASTLEVALEHPTSQDTCVLSALIAELREELRGSVSP